MKLRSSVRDSVKVMNLEHSMESSMCNVVSAGLVAESTAPKQQSTPKFCPLDH
ncbi:unnamed protein product [Hymenolepis diminuta]|uniref:Uncharacterized protein n=1 Tax=Hymenolepis diminuta TaxID=6216 RepID=A0A564YVX4_HYMDI|nr:unnamed protein product [Hymenolepis diminuta]